MLELGEIFGFCPSLDSTNPTKSPPGSKLCLYFTSFFATCCTSLLFPRKSPILHHFLRDTFRGCPVRGRRVYLPTGELTRGSANIAPASTSWCPEGGTKCQTTPDHVITDYTLTHPTILLGHSQKIWGLRGRARELSGDIFYAKDVPRQRALCHPPPTFRAPWVFPEFPKAQKTSAYLPVLTNSAYFALQTKTVSWEQKKKKTLHFFQFYELALPSVDLLSHQTQQ